MLVGAFLTSFLNICLRPPFHTCMRRYKFKNRTCYLASRREAQAVRRAPIPLRPTAPKAQRRPGSLHSGHAHAPDPAKSCSVEELPPALAFEPVSLVPAQPLCFPCSPRCTLASRGPHFSARPQILPCAVCEIVLCASRRRPYNHAPPMPRRHSNAHATTPSRPALPG